METEGLPHGRGEETSALPRAVLDANVYVAAYLSRNPRSPNKELFRRWRAREFVLLISKAILEEVIEKFDELGDDPAWACAVVGKANYLVTYDPHFDCLGGEYQGIQILDGLHFLYIVRGDMRRENSERK